MSMISIKNFISPFTNTVHAVTIVLVTVLFALFRLQGGGVSANVKSRPAPIETQIELSSPDELLNEVPTEKKAASKPAANALIKLPEKAESGKIQISDEDSDLIEEFIDKKSLAQPQKPVVKQQDPGGLDDIEKSLGMR